MTEQLRKEIENLQRHPDKQIIIERPKKRGLSPPPEIVTNVLGSSSAAGSGEFHIYKHARRKEAERMKRFEEEREAEIAEKEFEAKRSQLKHLEDSKTAKNRKRRQKRMKNKLKPQQQQKQDPSTTGSAESKNYNEDQSDVENAKEITVKNLIIETDDII